MRISEIIQWVLFVMRGVLFIFEILAAGLIIHYSYIYGELLWMHTKSGYSVLRFVANRQNLQNIQWDMTSAQNLALGLANLLGGFLGTGLCLIFFIGALWGILNALFRALEQMSGVDIKIFQKSS